MKRRLFVAVTLDERTRAGCAAVAERLRGRGFAAKWVPPENYHLTVAFLGSVDEDRVGAVVGAVRDVAPSLGAFDVPLDTVGAFPDARRPRIAWIGPRIAVPAFGTLCGVVRSALVARGFSFDPHADAHVTLARADGHAPLPRVEEPRLAPLRVAQLALYESFTEPEGARYQAFERFPLQG